MKLSNDNGASGQGSPVKTLTKHASHFIASCARFAMSNPEFTCCFALCGMALLGGLKL